MNSNFNSKKILTLTIVFATTIILSVNIQSIMAQSNFGDSLSGNAIITDGNGAPITNGTNGQNGADGQSGSFGHSGANGQNGANGKDGSSD